MGGGGGDNSWVMWSMMQQQKQQQEAAAAQLARDNLARSQGYEKTNYDKYTGLVSDQNKKLADLWGQYNSNIDQILKLDPSYTAHQKYTFNPYQAAGFTFSNAQDDGTATDQKQADDNISTLDGLYTQLDKKSFDDAAYAQKQLDESKAWLDEATRANNIKTRTLSAAPPAPWSVVGGTGAGADTLGAPKAPGNAVGFGDPKADQSLAGVFANASTPTRAARQSGAGRMIY